MAQVNRKSSSMSPEDRNFRREEITFKRDNMRRIHGQNRRYYVRYHTTTFDKRQSDRANARYAALPDGAMHNLPLGHIVYSNDHKRAVAALKAQISSDQVAVEKKAARKPRVKKAD